MEKPSKISKERLAELREEGRMMRKAMHKRLIRLYQLSPEKLLRRYK